MSSTNGTAVVDELRATVSALESRVDRHEALLRDVELELHGQRLELRELRGVVESLDARQRRTIWRAAAVISAAAPALGELLRHALP